MRSIVITHLVVIGEQIVKSKLLTAIRTVSIFIDDNHDEPPAGINSCHTSKT